MSRIILDANIKAEDIGNLVFVTQKTKEKFETLTGIEAKYHTFDTDGNVVHILPKDYNHIQLGIKVINDDIYVRYPLPEFNYPIIDITTSVTTMNKSDFIAEIEKKHDIKVIKCEPNKMEYLKSDGTHNIQTYLIDFHTFVQSHA